jgi:hypothetical protein
MCEGWHQCDPSTSHDAIEFNIVHNSVGVGVQVLPAAGAFIFRCFQVQVLRVQVLLVNASRCRCCRCFQQQVNAFRSKSARWTC